MAKKITYEVKTRGTVETYISIVAYGLLVAGILGFILNLATAGRTGTVAASLGGLVWLAGGAAGFALIKGFAEVIILLRRQNRLAHNADVSYRSGVSMYFEHACSDCLALVPKDSLKCWRCGAGFEE